MFSVLCTFIRIMTSFIALVACDVVLVFFLLPLFEFPPLVAKATPLFMLYL